jgi:hypothetical protein
MPGTGGAARRTVLIADLRRELQASESALEFRARVKAIVYPEPRPRAPGAPQLVFWALDATGLPERPWRVGPDTVFDCRALGCQFTARICVTRQMASDLQRTKDTWRGEASIYPRCVTERCAQGRGIREALDPAAGVTWHGAGPGKRFEPSRRDAVEVARARARLRACGALDEAPTIDTPVGPVEGEG